MPRKRMSWIGITLVILGIVATTPARGGGNQIGVGANYWRTLEDIGDAFDRDGLSWLITYQRNLNRLMALQADVEWFRSGFGGARNDVFAPQGFILAGGALYAGLGIGIYYSDGEFNSKPFYILRAGLDLELFPTVHLDINANYQFTEWDDINALEDKLGSDTITLGAAVRIEF